jgi:hypothetical protein
MACYGDSFNFLYADDIRTSQETYIWASMACYGDRFNFYMQIIFVPHRKDTYRPLWPVTGIALLSYMQMIVPHRKLTYRPPRPDTGIDLKMLYSVKYVWSMMSLDWFQVLPPLQLCQHTDHITQYVAQGAGPS